MSGSRQRRGPTLGRRAEHVFDAWLGGRGDTLHPADRAEAAAFWNWLGTIERPDVAAAPVRRPFAPIAAAAAVVLALVGGGAWYLRPAADPGFVASYASGHAQRRAVRLTDGSTVTLAPDTRIDLAWTAGERRLVLQRGQALFAVAKDADRPFIVATRYGEVRAVGTAFDVDVRGDAARVAVVEGVVKVALPGERAGAAPERLARKGERLRFAPATGSGGGAGFIRPEPDADVEGATAWTRGQLIFHGEPLSEVIATVNLYARDRLVLTDPRAANTPVFGIVDQGDTAVVRDLIANPRAVAIQREDGSAR